MNEPDLRRLARDRPLLTPEIHVQNDFYGYAHVLKRWAGLPVVRPLAAVAEHGLPLQSEIWEVDLHSSLPTLLTPNLRRVRAYQETAAAGRVAEAIGPPIAYARAQREPLAPPMPAEGPVIAFPAHSSHHVDAVFDADAFAGTLVDIGRRWGGVRVCLYWRDVLNGAAEPYLRRGLECVTAGHVYDRKFLPRLRNILAAGRAVVTNEVGTHVLYAVLFGRPTWIVAQPIDYRDHRPVPVVFEAPEADVAEALFLEERTDVTRDQADFVAEVAGLGHVRTPTVMAALLDDARRRLRRSMSVTGRVEAAGRARVHLAKEALRHLRGVGP